MGLIIKLEMVLCITAVCLGRVGAGEGGRIYTCIEEYLCILIKNSIEIDASHQ